VAVFVFQQLDTLGAGFVTLGRSRLFFILWGISLARDGENATAQG
jgi:hypothetical protein